MSVGIVDKQTGDRIPTAGMPAIDDALDLTSVNPVQNAVITAALANKQDKTDISLQTTDKTVVGAINEHEGDIDSLKNGLTNYENQNDLNLEVPDRINLFDKDNIDSINKYYDGANWINQGSGGWKTVFVPVVAGRTYTSSGFPHNSGAASVFVKADKSTVLLTLASANNNSTFVVPDMAEYVGFAIWTPDEDYTSAQLELGSTATAYTPYIPSVESRIEAVESGLADAQSGLTSIINQVGGIYVFRRNTSSSAASITFTYTGTRYAGLFFNISNNGKCSVYAVTYNNSGTTKSYLEKLAGDTLGSLVINNDNGNINADMSNWSSCILIVSDNNFTVS